MEARSLLVPQVFGQAPLRPPDNELHCASSGQHRCLCVFYFGPGYQFARNVDLALRDLLQRDLCDASH
jgi:hypothetical protein